MNYDNASLPSVVNTRQKGQTSRPHFVHRVDPNKPSLEHSLPAHGQAVGVMVMFRSTCRANSWQATKSDFFMASLPVPLPEEAFYPALAGCEAKRASSLRRSHTDSAHTMHRPLFFWC